jgi:hypothetical protein
VSRAAGGRRYAVETLDTTLFASAHNPNIEEWQFLAYQVSIQPVMSATSPRSVESGDPKDNNENVVTYVCEDAL